MHDPDPCSLLADGSCCTCKLEIDDNEQIQCFRCKINFHALCKQSNDAICNKSLLGLFLQRSTKKNFAWYCDRCLTDIELISSQSDTVQNQKVQDLENKIDLLSAKVGSISDLLTPQNQSGQLHTPIHTLSNGNISNAWSNTSKITILKNNLGVTPNLNQLEQRIIGSKIKVSHSKRNSNGDVVITCPSTSAANKIKDLAVELLPEHTVKDPQVKYSWINVVGFETNHNTGAVYDLLVKHNPILDSLKDKTEEQAKDFLEVKAVKPCVKNPTINRALIRVSNSLRQVIKMGKDKLMIGLYSCKVYDQAPMIKRCNRCQQYGHWVASCVDANGRACGKCASKNHESFNCTADKRNTSEICCINCKRAGIVNLHPPHTADSPKCPCFIQYRTKLYTDTNNISGNRRQHQTGNGQRLVTPQFSAPSFYQGTAQYNSSFPSHPTLPHNPQTGHYQNDILPAVSQSQFSNLQTGNYTLNNASTFPQSQITHGNVNQYMTPAIALNH